MSGVALLGCGGGSGGSSTEMSAEGGAQNAVALLDDGHGTLMIETRFGKTTVDAWFSAQAVPSGLAATEPDWQQGTDRCWLSDGGLGQGLVNNATFSETRDAGDRLTLSSRTGENVQLDAQRLGGQVVYSTDARWLVDTVPDDWLLDIEGGSGYPAVSGIAVPAVTAPSLLAPADARVFDIMSAIEWTTGAATGTRVQLSLGFASFSDGRSGLQVLDCDLDDDGVFQLPEALLAGAVANPGLPFTLSRSRRDEHAHGDASLTVVSLAYR